MSETQEPIHGPTALVCDVLEALLSHGGWLRVTDLADRTGSHRDNVRRVLQELTRREWIRTRKSDDGSADLYSLGPEWGRIGNAYIQLLAAQQAVLRRDFDRATVPHEWIPGPRGAEFRPLKKGDS